ncbi:MAG: hypothetical protein IKS80_07495 [Bacteroidaceae bacterium]|nr:hypothetical protein [Bacteroidaceae bacterium]
MVKTLLLTLVIVAAAMLLLSVRILLKKGGRFHSQHIGQSRAMRDRGIRCVQAQDLEARLPNPMAVDKKSVEVKG